MFWRQILSERKCHESKIAYNEDNSRGSCPLGAHHSVGFWPYGERPDD